MSALVVIPARYGSTRLPGKPLIKLRGKTLVERVYDRVKLCTSVKEIIVATDDIRIFNHVKKFGGHAMMTRSDHENGTRRCAEVASRLTGFEYVINVQGDEPLIHPGQIDHLINYMRDRPILDIATLVKRIDQVEDLENPSVVKVVRSSIDEAMYFSRSAIPFMRDRALGEWLQYSDYFKHVGMYGYKKESLIKLASLPTSELEETEKLEQLNWLYHGFRIFAAETDMDSIGVDTPEDIQLVENLLSLAGQ